MKIEIRGKKIFKVECGKKLFGVCNGLALFFNIHPWIMRAIFIGLGLIHGIGILLYIVAAILLPKEEMR